MSKSASYEISPSGQILKVTKNIEVVANPDTILQALTQTDQALKAQAPKDTQNKMQVYRNLGQCVCAITKEEGTTQTIYGNVHCPELYFYTDWVMKKDKDIIQDAACGDGPVDAALKTMDRIAGVTGQLMDYSLQAVTRGKDAVGEVSMQVDFGDKTVNGKASSTDIVEASAKAYLNCINSYVVQKTAPSASKAKTKKPAS